MSAISITCSWSNLTPKEFAVVCNFIATEMPNVREGEVLLVQSAPVQSAPVQAPQVQLIQNFNSHQSSRRKNNRVQYPCPNGCINDEGKPIHGSKFSREQSNVKFCGQCARGRPDLKSFQQWKDHDKEVEKRILQQAVRSIASQRYEEEEEEEEEEEQHQFNM